MPEQIDLFEDPNNTEFKKFKKKLLREGYTVTKKKVNGYMVETYTRGK